MRKTTRNIPLVFVGGAPDRVENVKAILPDAVYTSWRGIRGALKRAIESGPPDPIVPRSLFDVYVGRPLAAKLGIKPGTIVALIGAPDGFTKTLGRLPVGVVLHGSPRRRSDLILWFVRLRGRLEREIVRMAGRLGPAALWIVWRKKASHPAGDISQADVRRVGLACGLVDYKICSIDSVWSGLLFRRRAAQGAAS